MSQSIHNDGNWQDVSRGEWVSKAEHEALKAQMERLTAPVSVDKAVEDIWCIGNRLTEFDKKKDQIKAVIESAIIAARASQQKETR